MNISRIAALALALVAGVAGSAGAADLMPAGAFVQGGWAPAGTGVLTAGAVWPWSWHRAVRNGEVSGLTEVFVSEWSAKAVDGRRNFTQLGLLPLLRARPAQGRSPWFVEGGIGLSLMHPIYNTPRKQFSTSFNFYDVAGIGRSFGERRERELSLRLTHISNAGIKKPNPGENLLQLRYAVMF